MIKKVSFRTLLRNQSTVFHKYQHYPFSAQSKKAASKEEQKKKAKDSSRSKLTWSYKEEACKVRQEKNSRITIHFCLIRQKFFVLLGKSL